MFIIFIIRIGTTQLKKVQISTSFLIHSSYSLICSQSYNQQNGFTYTNTFQKNVTIYYFDDKNLFQQISFQQIR